VLRASSVHVYLTRPFVLSWSALEAMACGCVVLGSNTAPVREIIEHGRNGFLTDFFDVKAMTEQITGLLDAQGGLASVRESARATVLERYALKKLLPARARWIQKAVNSKGGRAP
jgi:glycosyltransferase involved in cell wall biosynthesis